MASFNVKWEPRTFKIYVLFYLSSVFLVTILATFLFLFHKWPYPEQCFYYLQIWVMLNLLLGLLLWFLWKWRKYYWLTISFWLLPASVTILVYLTGSNYSLFFIFYFFIIIASAILLSSKTALGIAAWCFILYGSLLDLEYFGLIPLFMEKPAGGELFINLLVSCIAFLAVAFLMNFLVRRLQTSEQKAVFLEALYKFILESIQSGVVTVDEKKRILYMNPAAEQILGYSREALKGRNLECLLPDKLSSFKREEFHFKRPDGKIITLGISEYALKTDSQTVGKIFVFQDLTEVKKIERMRIIGELASHLAHDIKTPLTSISGCLEMVSSEATISEDLKPLIASALKEIKRLDALVYDFLSYARPTNKRIQVNLDAVIKDTVSLLQNSFAKENVIFRMSLVDNAWIMGNPEELKRVFMNLFVNAKEAMPSGGGITITMKTTETEVVVKVRDTGLGIPEEIQPNLFEPFVTTKPDGTGLGLAIVHRIVIEHNGRISFKTQKGKGSCFIISFPLITQIQPS